MQFALGFASAVATYFLIGAGIGIYVVASNAARFFAAGWQYRRMLHCIVTTALVWPAALWHGV